MEINPHSNLVQYFDTVKKTKEIILICTYLYCLDYRVCELDVIKFSNPKQKSH